MVELIVVVFFKLRTELLIAFTWECSLPEKYYKLRGMGASSSLTYAQHVLACTYLNAHTCMIAIYLYSHNYVNTTPPPPPSFCCDHLRTYPH